MTFLPCGWFVFHQRTTVGQTRGQCRHVCAIFQACRAIVLPVNTEVLFFAFWCEIWHKRWINRHPEKLRGGHTCCFEANFELLLLFYFYAWVFACPIFYAFSNYAKIILSFRPKLYWRKVGCTSLSCHLIPILVIVTVIVDGSSKWDMKSLQKASTKEGFNPYDQPDW